MGNGNVMESKPTLKRSVGQAISVTPGRTGNVIGFISCSL
jgi:hypothetical protein